MLITEKGGTRFINYDNIHMVKLPYFKERKWRVSVIFTVEFDGRSSYEFPFKTEDDAKKRYREIIDSCTHYHERHRVLEHKLDKLFSLIEILPGGEEYEKAKADFTTGANH